MIREAISKLTGRENLNETEATAVMEEIMSGNATPAQIASFLTALRMKEETPEEIAAFARVMRQHCLGIQPKTSGRLIDIVGTGGDAIKTFNVSTTAAFVAVGAGAHVAKHGNRSVTSKCGSADLLEALGVKLDLPPMQVERIIEEIGIGFLFAPSFHPAMKYAVLPRREIGIRTVFNILGPLTNPAGASAHLIGVYEERLVQLMARTLKTLGTKEAMIVHGLDGLDEISTIGPTKIARVDGGEIETSVIQPEDLGFRRVKSREISGESPEGSAAITFRLLNGQEDGARREILIANTAGALIVAGLAEDFQEAIPIAEDSIESGRAYGKLKELVLRTGGDSGRLEELEAAYA
jgi:anthranilate phosphoribosyltransferase